jgi:hypothetical protein
MKEEQIFSDINFDFKDLVRMITVILFQTRHTYGIQSHVSKSNNPYNIIFEYPVALGHHFLFVKCSAVMQQSQSFLKRH